MKPKNHLCGNQICGLVCLFVAVLFGTPRSSAQATGAVDFGDRVTNGPNAPVSDARTGERLAGDSWLAQLFYAEGRQVTDTSLLVSAGSPVPFRTGVASGYIKSQLLELPGTISGDEVTVQMRAWNSEAGSTYEDAVASPLGVTGVSGFVYVTVGGGERLPPDLIGLQGFSVGSSPSTPSLVVLTAPLDGALFPDSAVIVLQAKAAVAPGKAITQLQFYESTNLLGIATQPPYQLSLTHLLPARSLPYALSAIAFDDHGFFSTSAPVNVIISRTSPPPVVRFVQPLDGSVIFRYPGVALTVSVQDYTAGQNPVQFYSGDELLRTVAKPDYIDILTNSADRAKPYLANFYTLILTNLTIGTYDLSASYTDLFPNVGHSQHVPLTVSPPILSDPVNNPRGFLFFTVKGFIPGQTVGILTSTNLLDWIPTSKLGRRGNESTMVIGVEINSPVLFFRYSE
jgi:hypothetical protein